MRLRLQQYDIILTYIPGKDIPIPDTLSRDAQIQLEKEDLIPEVVSTITLAITETRRENIKKETENDRVFKKILELTESGWPKKNEMPEMLIPYYSIRNMITQTEGLLFKDQLVMIPSKLREEMMQQAHVAHSGIGDCRRRLKDTMYWPGMNKDIEQYIQTCESCIKHTEIQNKRETIIQHKRGDTPWSKIGMDLCQIDDRTLLVVTDYYSNFLSVEKLEKTNCNEVIRILLKMFAIHSNSTGNCNR